MTNMTRTDDGGGAPTLDADVVIIGAGPVGLSMANLIGLRGVRVIVLEDRTELIDYPRAIGIDDEALRSVQTMGLIDAVLPHTTPQHVMRLVNGRGTVMAEISPSTDEFGWSRRNGFNQPDVDRALYEGAVARDTVEVRFGSRVEGLDDRGDHVLVTVAGADGPSTLVARFVVGAEGGKSFTRRHIGTTFEGQSPSTRWLVVDVNDDPLGTPNIFLGCDPRRPYVSVGLPHAVRRFEFMLFDKEPDSLVDDDTFVNRMLAPHVTHPEKLNFIRKRIYTHHSRIAGDFRKGNIFLAGDAAHLMPVWQGQGYNSGLRDATNLAWKLVAVVTGQAGEGILDSYTQERHDHAKAMIDLSTAFGRIVKPTNRIVAGARDVAAAALNLLPSVKSYFVQMKYKPMPRYTQGVVVDASTFRAGSSEATLTRRISAFTTANTDVSPVGTQLIQPEVETVDGARMLLDDACGNWWSVLLWGINPEQVFDDSDLATLRRLGARFVTIRPRVQLGGDPSATADTIAVGDTTGRLKAWFNDRPTPVLFVRPDRFIAAACLTQDASATLAALVRAAHLPAHVPAVPAAAGVI